MVKLQADGEDNTSHEVLDVVLAHTCDVQTLAACSGLNQHCRKATYAAVRLSLPALVYNCEIHLKNQQLSEQLQWLCRTAGPAAVNTYEAGCAILHLLGQWQQGGSSSASAADEVYMTGLQITDNFVCFLSRHFPSWIADILSRGRPTAVNKLFRVCGGHLHGVAAEESAVNAVAGMLPQLSAEHFPALLRIACGRNYYRHALASKLLDHDRDCLQILHAQSVPADASHEGSSGAASTTDKHRCDEAEQLLVDVLSLCIKHNERQLIQRLCATPAAQQLALLRLPGAQRFTTKQLFDMIMAAGKAQLHGLVDKLARLAHNRQLDSGGVVSLLKTCINTPAAFGCSSSSEALALLAGLNLDEHIGPNDFLELFECCCNLTLWQRCDPLETVISMSKAVQQITDIPRFVGCLKAAADTGKQDALEATISTLPAAIQQVQTQDWFEIIKSCLHQEGFVPRGIEDLAAVQQFSVEQLSDLLQESQDWCVDGLATLLALPAAAQLVPALVHSMLLKALRVEDLRYLDHEWRVDVGLIRKLFELPSARGMSLDAVQQLLEAAWASGSDHIAQLIYGALPEAAKALPMNLVMTGELFVKAVSAACKREDDHDLDQLLQYKFWNWVTVAHVEDLSLALLDLLQGHGCGTYCRMDCYTLSMVQQALERLSNTQVFESLGTDAVLKLAKAALQRTGGRLFLYFTESTVGAQHMSAQQLCELLQVVVQHKVRDVDVWHQLLKLPAGQQLRPNDLVQLLQALAQSKAGQKIAELLLALPSAGSITCEQLVDLTEACMVAKFDMPGMLLKQVPAAKQLLPEQVKHLLRLAIQFDNGSLSSALCLLPAAVAGSNAELQMLVESWHSIGLLIGAHTSTSNRLTHGFDTFASQQGSVERCCGCSGCRRNR